MPSQLAEDLQLALRACRTAPADLGDGPGAVRLPVGELRVHLAPDLAG